MHSKVPIIQPKKINPPRNVQKKRKEKPLSSFVMDSLPNHNITTKKRTKSTRTARKCTTTLNNSEPSKKDEQSCHKNEASSSNPPENVIPQQNKVNDGDIAIANRRPQRIPSFNLNEPPAIIDEDESNPESITKNDTNQINAEDVITNAEGEIANATKIRAVDLNEPLNLSTDEEIAQIIIDLKNENTHEVVAPRSYDLNKKNVSTIRDSKGKGKEIVTCNPKDKGKKKKILHHEEKLVNPRPARKIGKRCQPKIAKPQIAPSPDPITELPPLIQVPEPEPVLPDEDQVVNITSDRPKANPQVWFNLSPSENRNGGTLPPLTSPHILAWDQDITIEKVQMFIATKLNLEKEEIEVILRGLPIMSPTMTLGGLQQVWKQYAPERSQAIKGKEGEPPKEECVLSFTYARV